MNDLTLIVVLVRTIIGLTIIWSCTLVVWVIIQIWSAHKCVSACQTRIILIEAQIYEIMQSVAAKLCSIQHIAYGVLDVDLFINKITDVKKSDILYSSQVYNDVAIDILTRYVNDRSYPIKNWSERRKIVRKIKRALRYI